MRAFGLIFMGLTMSFMAFAAMGQRNDRVSQTLDREGEKTYLVYKYEIMQQIAPPAVRLTEKAFQDADTLGVDFVLLHLNTYGGTVDGADVIRTLIMQSPVPVIVFIDNNAASAGALISIAADRIYMRPGGNIGAATVVDQTGDVVPDKYQSYMRSMMRSTAEAKGRDPEIAQAMVDPSIVIEGIIEEGKVLTFTSSEALEFGFSEGSAENIEEVLQMAGILDYELVEQKLSFVDRAIGLLVNPAVSGILIMLILGGIYFELQTPGIGFPIMIALGAALLYFAPLYLEGLASHWEISFFIVGLILVAVELFVIPGFGVTGVLGIAMMVTGLALAMVGNVGWDFTGVPAEDVLKAFLIVIIALFVSLTTSFYLGQKLFTTTRFGELALTSVMQTTSGYTSANVTMRSMVGKEGISATMLRPSGKVEIEDDTYDATALSGFIERGQKVRVVKYETSQLFVVKA